jgi:glycosyltransferase involved in cell wall biosynthesis
MCKLSIITVVFNNIGCIEATILNVLETIGDRDDIEYIVIDGNSDDGTVDVIKKYEERITLWISEPDKGIYDAMNKGVKLSNGEWINFMNAGDVFSIPDFNLLYLPIVSENSHVIYGNVLLKRDGINSLVRAYPIYQINFSQIFCHQSSFTKTALLKKYPFSLEYRISADYDFFLKVYLLGYKFYYWNDSISIFEYGGVSSGINWGFITERFEIIFKSHKGFKNKISYSFKFFKTLVPFNRKIANKIVDKIKQRFIIYNG